MTKESTKESISLWCTEGGSDKVYDISIEDNGDDTYDVPFTYGRRGGPLNSGCKCQEVSYATAKKSFDKVVKEKLAKGYKIVEGGAVSSSFTTASEKTDTGIYPMLLDVADESTHISLQSNKDFIAQEKHDGKRLMLRRVGGHVTAINRKGQEVNFPEVLAGPNGAMVASEDFIIDGELVGELLFVFDVIEYGGIDLRALTYEERYNFLSEFNGASNLIIVKSAKTQAEKIALENTLRGIRAEGIVYKNKKAVFSVGKNHNQMWKYKFWHTATCIVKEANVGVDSVSLQLFDDAGVLIDVGNCTINKRVCLPKAGDLLEIRYLYAYRGGSLYQPTMIALRDDIDKEECLMSQLSYKE